MTVTQRNSPFGVTPIGGGAWPTGNKGDVSQLLHRQADESPEGTARLRSPCWALRQDPCRMRRRGLGDRGGRSPEPVPCPILVVTREEWTHTSGVSLHVSVIYRKPRSRCAREGVRLGSTRHSVPLHPGSKWAVLPAGGHHSRSPSQTPGEPPPRPADPAARTRRRALTAPLLVEG